MKQETEEALLPRYMVSKFKKYDVNGNEIDAALVYESSGSDFSISPEELTELNDEMSKQKRRASPNRNS